MATVRREPPSAPEGYDYQVVSRYEGLVPVWNFEVRQFLGWCILDLADGRHAKDCDCTGMQGILLTDFIDNKATNTDLVEAKWNACLTIARCARDLTSYEVEVPDASGPPDNR